MSASAEEIEKSLRNAALRALARQSYARFGLRRLLSRRLPEDDGAKDILESVLDRLELEGLLSDLAFAEGKARWLAGRGLPAVAISARLGGLGIDPETRAAALALLAQEQGEERPSDRLAAEAYARRRRLGPYRVDAAERAGRRDKDMAALIRRGFSLSVARAVIDGEDE